MKFFDNVKFDQINPNNLSAKFLKVWEYFFTKNKISVFANKLLNCYCTICLFFLYSAGSKTLPESKCPELLANYCDMLLRKTPLSKRLTSEEVEKKLRDVVRLFLSRHHHSIDHNAMITYTRI